MASTAALPGAIGRLSRTFGQGFQYLRQGATERHPTRPISEYHVLAGFNFLIDAFYGSIRQDAPVPVPYRDMLKVAAMTEAVFAHLREEPSRVA